MKTVLYRSLAAAVGILFLAATSVSAADLDGELIALAKRAYPKYPAGARSSNLARREKAGCGTPEMTRLALALHSSTVSETTKAVIRSIVQQSVPVLEKQHTTGNFIINYTNSNPSAPDYLSDDDALSLGIALETAYERLLAAFKKIDRGPTKGPMIVRVYDLPEVGGRTWPGENILEFDAPEARNICLQNVYTAHELFHRVQYAHGFPSRAEKSRLYWSEGTAAWAEHFVNSSTFEYLLRIDESGKGLNAPGTAITSRAYDSAHLWTYLAERYVKRRHGKASAATAIHALLDAYEKQGKRALMEPIFYASIQVLLGGEKSKSRRPRALVEFPAAKLFFQDWHKANFFTDLVTNPRFKYNDSGAPKPTCLGETQFPGPSLEGTTTLTTKNTYWKSGSKRIGVGGAHYYVIDTASDVLTVSFQLKGAGVNWSVVALRNGAIIKTVELADKGFPYFNFARTKHIDRFVVIAGGVKIGAKYSLDVQPSFVPDASDPTPTPVPSVSYVVALYLDFAPAPMLVIRRQSEIDAAPSMYQVLAGGYSSAQSAITAACSGISAYRYSGEYQSALAHWSNGNWYRFSNDLVSCGAPWQ